MSTFQTQTQQYVIFAHFSLDGGNVIKALRCLLYEMNFHQGDLNNVYKMLRDLSVNRSFSILFGDIGPFSTFEKFRAFFENASMHGLLEFDVEEFPHGTIEFRLGTLSNVMIDELVSKIQITPCISLHEVFFQVFPIGEGVIDGSSLYITSTLKSFAGGRSKKFLRELIEKLLVNLRVEIEKTPNMKLHFHETWMNDSFTQFITRLIEKLGFSEIEYVAESSSLKEDIPDSTNPVFNKLNIFFLEHNSIKFVMMNSDKFYNDICGVSRENFIESTKNRFNLFVQFLFTIQNGVATPHRRFNLHVGHFVLAFMKVIGASLDGIHVQTVIKSGPDWISGKSKQNIVCSSVATGQKCRNPKCVFLHVTRCDYGIISLHSGIVMVICQAGSGFDKVPNAKSVLKPLLFKDSFISFEVAGGCSAKTETLAVAGGCSFREEIRAVAGGCSAKTETLAVAGGCSFREETRAVAGGCSADSKTCAVAGGCSFREETRAVAGGCSADSKTCAVDGWLTRKTSLKPPQPSHDSDDEEYDPNDPLIQLLFSRPFTDYSQGGSKTDRIVRELRNASSSEEILRLTVSVIHNLKLRKPE